jgi:hypothetical protein
MEDLWAMPFLDTDKTSTNRNAEFQPPTEEMLRHNVHNIKTEHCGGHILLAAGGSMYEKTRTLKLISNDLVKKECANVGQHMELRWRHGLYDQRQSQSSSGTPAPELRGGANQKSREQDHPIYEKTVNATKQVDTPAAQADGMLLLDMRKEDDRDKFFGSCPGSKTLFNQAKDMLVRAKVVPSREELVPLFGQFIRPNTMGGFEFHRDSEDYSVNKDGDKMVLGVAYLLNAPTKTTRVAGAVEEAKFEEVGEAIAFDPDMYHRSGDYMKPGCMMWTIFFTTKAAKRAKLAEQARARPRTRTLPLNGEAHVSLPDM